jgi:hypothetical protein
MGEHRFLLEAVGFSTDLLTELENEYFGMGPVEDTITEFNKSAELIRKNQMLIQSNSQTIKRLHNTIKNLNSGNRKVLQQQNLDAAIAQIQPDLIHLQWPSVIPWFETILNTQKITSRKLNICKVLLHKLRFRTSGKLLKKKQICFYKPCLPGFFLFYALRGLRILKLSG